MLIGDVSIKSLIDDEHAEQCKSALPAFKKGIVEDPNVELVLIAQRFDLLRYGLGGTPLGSLEQHVLEQMRSACDLISLVTGARAEQEVDAYGVRVRQSAGENTQSVVQNRAFKWE